MAPDELGDRVAQSPPRPTPNRESPDDDRGRAIRISTTLMSKEILAPENHTPRQIEANGVRGGDEEARQVAVFDHRPSNT